jgi:hypothetical protein
VCWECEFKVLSELYGNTALCPLKLSKNNFSVTLFEHLVVVGNCRTNTKPITAITCYLFTSQRRRGAADPAADREAQTSKLPN